MKPTRREFLAGIAAAGGLSKVETQRPEHPYPWSHLTDGLIEKEGPYADYAAFCEWAGENWLHGSEDFEAECSSPAVYVLCCMSFDWKEQQA